jgi:hypothetical protein
MVVLLTWLRPKLTSQEPGPAAAYAVDQGLCVHQSPVWHQFCLMHWCHLASILQQNLLKEFLLKNQLNSFLVAGLAACCI